jgi:hypothetical protein
MSQSYEKAWSPINNSILSVTNNVKEAGREKDESKSIIPSQKTSLQFSLWKIC